MLTFPQFMSLMLASLAFAGHYSSEDNKPWNLAGVAKIFDLSCMPGLVAYVVAVVRRLDLNTALLFTHLLVHRLHSPSPVQITGLQKTLMSTPSMFT
jgi:hypothetical protein